MTTVQDETEKRPMSPANAGHATDRRDSETTAEDSAACGKSPAPLVLIIEGDDLLRWALAEAAGDTGYGTISVRDVATARQAPSGRLARTTVVLVDSEATRADRQGLAFLRASLPASTFAVMTDDATRERACSAGLGIAAIFVKPFDLTAVQSYLRSLAAHREPA